MRPGSLIAGLAWGAAMVAAITAPLGPETPPAPTPPAPLSVASIEAGAGVFAREFPTCLGEDGTPEPPDAMLADAAWDGGADDLARWLQADFGGAVPPGLAQRLTPAAQAALADFLRAHLAGREMTTWGRWLHPLPAPDVELACGEGDPKPLAAWRGEVVRLAAGDGRLTVGSCTVATPGAWGSYALIAGLPPGLLSGTTFVIDADGMLAARELPGPGMAPGRIAAIRKPDHRHAAAE